MVPDNLSEASESSESVNWMQRLALNPGDKVAFLAPARKITAEEMLHAEVMFQGSGLIVEMGQTIGAEADQFAGPDELRAGDLQRCLEDPEIRAIICARGGYGTARLLPRLNPAALRNDPKWIAGFSDVTALHGWVSRNTDLPSLHSTMPVLINKDSGQAWESMIDALMGRSPKAVRNRAHSLNRNGKSRGKLIGGNLSVLYSLRGTPYFPDLQGAILFLEDLDEYLYHIDRMMLNFKLGGLFGEIGGLVIGGMSDMNDNTIPFGKNAEEIIRDQVEGFGFPVCFGYPAGHIADNRALVFGMEAELEVNAKGGLLKQAL